MEKQYKIDGKPVLVNNFEKEFYVSADIGTLQDYSTIAVVTKVIPGFRWSGGFAQDNVDREYPELAEYQLNFLEQIPLKTSYDDIVKRISQVTENLISKTGRKVNLVVDSTGVGQPVLQSLQKVAPVEPVGVTITGGNEANKTAYGYTVPKKELISVLQLFLGNDRLEIAKGLKHAQTLYDELKDYEYKFTQAGNMTFNAREGKHDDLILAVAIGLWYAEKKTLQRLKAVPRLI